jgi:hypothetical protein
MFSYIPVVMLCLFCGFEKNKKNVMQTIMGLFGAIMIDLAKTLKEFTNGIRLVSRNPKKVNPSGKFMAANFLNAIDVNKAVKGSSVVYLSVIPF